MSTVMSITLDQARTARPHGAISIGANSRTLGTMAIERPHFMTGVTAAIDGPADANQGHARQHRVPQGDAARRSSESRR